VRAAARAGEYFAWFLFGLGVVELLVGFGISGLWAMVLGWFILGAARAEGARAVLDEGLAGMRIGELMTPHPITVPDTITADELLECVRVHRCTSFPLTHDHEITGLATLARCRAVDPRRRAGVMVRDVAWPIERVTVARPDELAADVLRRVSGGDGRILVLEHGHLRGIVSPSDVTRAVSAATG
jgi:CBS-domain-containing membrane protein